MACHLRHWHDNDGTSIAYIIKFLDMAKPWRLRSKSVIFEKHLKPRGSRHTYLTFAFLLAVSPADYHEYLQWISCIHSNRNSLAQPQSQQPYLSRPSSAATTPVFSHQRRDEGAEVSTWIIWNQHLSGLSAFSTTKETHTTHTVSAMAPSPGHDEDPGRLGLC